jgi:uncharacterized protein with PIN domain
MTEEELRARLLAAAEKAITDMLAGKPAVKEMSLTDIERLALRTGQRVQAKVLEELGQASREVHSTEVPVCEGCGRRMQRRGVRRRQVVTEVGEMTLERAYYVCPECGASFFPPG